MGGTIAALFATGTRQVDEIAVAGIAGTLGLITWEGWAVIVQGHPFDPQAFGIGVAAILGAMGTGLGLREKLTPQAPPAAAPDPGDKP